jgi:hypothetical protein
MLVTRYSGIQTAVNRQHVSACFDHLEGGSQQRNTVMASYGIHVKYTGSSGVERCIVFRLWCVVYGVEFIVHDVYCILYGVQFIVHSV